LRCAGLLRLRQLLSSTGNPRAGYPSAKRSHSATHQSALQMEPNARVTTSSPSTAHLLAENCCLTRLAPLSIIGSEKPGLSAATRWRTPGFLMQYPAPPCGALCFWPVYFTLGTSLAAKEALLTLSTVEPSVVLEKPCQHMR